MRPARPLVLCTDLDGTFLGGSDEERAALYDFIERHRDDLRLVFVTGRDLPFVRTLWEERGLPRPDDIIGDVGTTVVSGATLKPHPALHAWIDSRWQDANARIHAKLKDEPGLELQPVPTERRVSYYYDPDKLRPDLRSELEAEGFDVILSANVYFDVMPRGVSKGPTLRRFVELEGIAPEQVLAAGDTLNDLTLLSAGFRSVAVGGSEPALLEALPSAEHIFRAEAEGCGGIAEALHHFGFVSSASAPAVEPEHRAS